MSIQAVTGAFTNTQITGAVILDQQQGASTDWTKGAIRTMPVAIQPTLVQKWRILGFSARAQLGIVRALLNPFYGRWTDLWVGLLVDKSISDFSGIQGDRGSVTLPQDLSTFAKLWDGQRDPPPPIITTPYAINPGQGWFGLTYMLPNPLDVRSGAQISMALILMPMLLAFGMGFKVGSCDFSVLYEDASA
jgi:hypothetical protein